MKRPRAGYVQQISVPLTPLSNLSTLYLLKSLVLMPGARCRKVGPAAEGNLIRLERRGREVGTENSCPLGRDISAELPLLWGKSQVG